MALDEIQNCQRPVREEISTIIPTLGRPLLEGCLESIARGSAWPSRLILVDQGSNPEVAQWVEVLNTLGLHTRHIQSNQRSRASAVNRGAGLVETPFLSVTDDDCLVQPDWLESLYTRLQQHPGAVITGRVEPAGAEAVTSIVTLGEARIYRQPLLDREPMTGGNLAMPKAVINQIGLYDEDSRLRFAEDVEYSYRLLRAGVPIVYAPEAVVYHIGWRNEQERQETYRNYALSQGSFYGKYLRQRDAFIALRAGLDITRHLWKWLRGRLTHQADLAMRGREYSLGLPAGILSGFRSPASPTDKARVN